MPPPAPEPYSRNLTATADPGKPACPSVDMLPAQTGFKGASVPRAVLRSDGIRPGLSTKVPAGAYRGTERWQKRKIFLKGMLAFLTAHPEMRRGAPDPKTGRHKDAMALPLFMRLLELETQVADHRTGREMCASKETIAKAAGCSVTTVQRFHRLASRVIQAMVPVAHGRLLTKKERVGLCDPCGVWWRRHSSAAAGQQRGVPTVWAFHTTARMRPFMLAAAIQPPPVDNYTPPDLQEHDAAPQPQSGSAPEKNHLTYNSPSGPTSSKSGSLRSPRGPGSARTASTKAGRASPAFQLAEKLVKRMPVLRSTHPQRLTPVLIPFVESRPAWDDNDLLDAFQDLGDISGLGIPSTDHGIETPWAFVKSLIDRLDPHDHPRLATIDPAELRCDRTECDHGWIPNVNSVQELLGLQPDSQRRCDQCRPGAWPPPKYLYGEFGDEQEPPF